MLDLDAAVDLDEIGLALGVHQELQRSQVLVPGLDHGSDGSLAEVLALGLGQGRTGRLFDDLLMATLDGAVALAQVDGVAEAVHGHLDLDVAIVAEVLLHVEGIVTEGSLGLRAADLEDGLELSRCPDEPHSLAAATAGGFDENGVADALGLLEGVGLVAERPGSRDRAQAVSFEQAAGRLL